MPAWRHRFDGIVPVWHLGRMLFCTVASHFERYNICPPDVHFSGGVVRLSISDHEGLGSPRRDTETKSRDFVVREALLGSIRFN